jgi:hypothetical protein
LFSFLADVLRLHSSKKYWATACFDVVHFLLFAFYWCCRRGCCLPACLLLLSLHAAAFLSLSFVAFAGEGFCFRSELWRTRGDLKQI